MNFASRFSRAFDNAVYLAGNGGPNLWDIATSWASDTSWVVAPPWAP